MPPKVPKKNLSEDASLEIEGSADMGSLLLKKRKLPINTDHDECSSEVDDDLSPSESHSSDEESSESIVIVQKQSKRQKKLIAKRHAILNQSAPVDTSKLKVKSASIRAAKKKLEEKEKQKQISRDTKHLRQEATKPNKIFEKDADLMFYVNKPSNPPKK